MKKLIKNNHFIITALILMITLISFSGVILHNDSIFILYGDSSQQYYQFLLGFYEKVKSGNFSMFDWSLGFGANGFSLIYYSLFSPFTYLTLLLKKEWIQYAILYLQILKLILIGNFTCLWLSKLSKNKNHVLIGSMVLTFCGWCFFYWHYDYLNSFVFYPLILYFIEKYLTENKKLGFIICVFLLTITNYYFMYMFVPFICLYTLFRYLIIHDDNKFKTVVIEALKFFGLLILSMLVGSFILLPSINIIISSTRISEEEVSLLIPWKDMYKIFTSMFTPAFYRYEPNYFIKQKQTLYQGWGGGASIYTSFSLLMFIPTLFLFKDKKKRNCLLAFGLILLIFMISPYFYKLFQGTIDTRFFYMFTIYMVMVMVEVLDNYKKEYFGCILTSFMVMVFLICLFVFISYKKYLIETNLLKNEIAVEMILIVIAFITIILIKAKQTKLLLIPIILECLLSNMMFVKYNEPMDKISIQSYGPVNDEIIKTIKNKDNGFYRIIGAKNYNDSYVNQSMGVSFYTSVYDYEMDDFLKSIVDSWAINYDRSLNTLYTLAGAKYWYPNDGYFVAPIGYEKVEGQDYYQNKYFVELGWVNNNVINDKAIDDVPYYYLSRVYRNYLTINDSDNYNYDLDDLEIIGFDYFGNKADFNLGYITSNSIFYLVNPNTTANYIDYYFNNELKRSESFWNYSLVIFSLSENQYVDRIIVGCDDNELLNQDMKLYVERNVDYLEQEVYKKRIQNSFTNVVFDGDYISGDIKIDEDHSLVFTQVPYDKGWKVKVDGKQIEYSKVNGGFIGFYLDSGNHTVEFEYTIPMLIPGIVVSLVSTLILVIYVKKVIKS